MQGYSCHYITRSGRKISWSSYKGCECCNLLVLPQVCRKLDIPFLLVLPTERITRSLFQGQYWLYWLGLEEKSG